MIKTIAHCGDIHIPKSIERHKEFREVFQNFYQSLKEKKPDRIVVGGDIYDNFIDIEGESLILVGEFLNRLSLIAPTRIIKGNHDYRKKNVNRTDTITTATVMMDNPNIIYYNKSGFYEDDNVVWVVWDYADKKDPWKEFSIKRDPTKIYIDIFHNEIEGCKYFNDYRPEKKYTSPSELKGDISLLNHIHLFQTFSNKTKAYSGSFLQLKFDETVDNHGYLLWNVQNKTFSRIEINNDYRLIKFEINPNQDYNKLHLISKHIGKYNKFRVEWTDYAAFITNENEQKIRKYLKDKYEADNIEIRPNRIYTDIKDGKMLSEIININDKEVQQEIIRQYLKDNKFEDEFIDKIVEVDNLVNERLQLSEARNVIWSIDKTWFNNFKSYGDNNVIEWQDINGIIQIGGENQQGKTSIIDAICFILYGTTTSTTKSEKNGNNRYINKNRKLNYCDGGIVLDVNGEKYIMHRKVEREYKKGREIKAVPMTLDYYKGSEMTEENKLTGERRALTQRLLDDVLGEFNDFIRMALTNADNLNSLLSMDRSIFIDSIIKDAGYDIFEKKLEEFKEYKKELNLDKIHVNVTETEKEIKNIEGDLKDKEDYLSDTNIELTDIENSIEEENKKKEVGLRRLHKIDDDILKININDVKSKIRQSEYKKIELTSEINEIEGNIANMPKEFDTNNYDKLVTQYEKYTFEKGKRDVELVQLESLYKQNEEKINNVEKDINIEKTRYLDYLKNNISALKVESREYINEINNKSSAKKLDIELQKNIAKNDLNKLKEQGLDEKQNITNYTNMLNGENQICPTCNQPILNKDEEHINGLINESKRKIEEITKEGKQKIELIKEYETKIENLNATTEKLTNDKRKEYDDRIKVFQDKIDNFNVSMIQDRIEEVMKNKSVAEKENESLDAKMDEREEFLERLETEIKKLNIRITALKVNKALYDKYVELKHKKDLLISENKDAQRDFIDNTRLLEEYTKNENLIKENEKINDVLNLINTELENLNRKRGELLNNKLSYSTEITLIKKSIDDLKEKLRKYVEQEKLEELHNVYLKLMHRTGLPTYLLTKNIDILNKELSSLLTNTDFTLFFDEDLNLKLQHNGFDGVISAIEASGYERTMISITLKTVLRIINFRSKPSIIFLDEVMNKCVGKSVDKLLELLETLTTKIDKIVLIEHNNEILSNLIIDCKKDENGISRFELI